MCVALSCRRKHPRNLSPDRAPDKLAVAGAWPPPTVARVCRTERGARARPLVIVGTRKALRIAVGRQSSVRRVTNLKQRLIEASKLSPNASLTGELPFYSDR